MIQCPHSIFFFRNSVEDFSIIDDFQGSKTALELLSPDLLVPANEGDYYQTVQPYKTNALYVEGANKQIETGDYIQVVRIKVGENNYVYRYKIFSDILVNTLRDFHIVPLGRPVVNPPEQKLHVIDIPGASGVLDLSNSLTKYPVFNNRTGSWNFAILADETDTPTSYSKTLNFLQGNNVKVMLEDDMDYYYQGRVYVENISPNSDGTASEVSLGYDLYPYKQSVRTSIDDWLWDSFNFETDRILQTVFKDIKIDPDGNWHEYDFSDYVDVMPTNPYFILALPFVGKFYIQLYNSDLNIIWKTYELSEGINYFNDLVFCGLTRESTLKMRFKYSLNYIVPRGEYEGQSSADFQASISIEFRSGRL